MTGWFIFLTATASDLVRAANVVGEGARKQAYDPAILGSRARCKLLKCRRHISSRDYSQTK